MLLKKNFRSMIVNDNYTLHWRILHTHDDHMLQNTRSYLSNQILASILLSHLNKISTILSLGLYPSSIKIHHNFLKQ